MIDLDIAQSDDLLVKIAKSDYKTIRILLERGNNMYKGVNIEGNEIPILKE